jgi:hypothetical protein
MDLLARTTVLAVLALWYCTMVPVFSKILEKKIRRNFSLFEHCSAKLPL